MKHEVFLNGFDIIIFKCINPFSKAFYMYHTRYKAYKTICYIPHKTFHRRQRVHHRNTYYDSFKMMKSFFFSFASVFTSTSFLLCLYISFAMSLILCWISLLIANFSNFLLDLFSLFCALFVSISTAIFFFVRQRASRQI